MCEEKTAAGVGVRGEVGNRRSSVHSQKIFIIKQCPEHIQANDSEANRAKNRGVEMKVVETRQKFFFPLLPVYFYTMEYFS